MLAEWSAVWRVEQPVQTTMPRPRLVAEAAARLPLQEDDIARAATTFKKRTGLEVDVTTQGRCSGCRTKDGRPLQTF